MAADEPPYLTVGTDVSAKYKGAFCEAKIKKVNRVVKCKVTFQNNQGSSMVPDDQIRGSLRIGALVEARHPEKNQYLDAIINKMQDYSQYTVVFDDGDETTLRRTSLCLKSGRHFAESPTLDQYPLTNPEHFSTPVIGVLKTKRKRRSTYNSAALDYSSSDEDIIPKKAKNPRNREKARDIGKLVCVDFGDRRKKDSWYPGLVVLANASQDTFKINTKDEYLIRSFRDGKYYQVPKKDTREFSREVARKIESNTLRIAVEKALLYCEKGELPPHWDKALHLGLENPSGDDGANDSDSDTSDDEPSEEKDRFVAQLYKFMDERGTPINKAPTVGNKDLNLYKLFKVVHKMGGCNRVTSQDKWKLVYTKMGLQSPTSTGSNQLKTAYTRFLHSFENFNRKLGCTMVSHIRSTRGSHRTDRNFTTRNTVLTKVKMRTKDKSLEKKPEEKPSTSDKKDVKPKVEEKLKKKIEKPSKLEDKVVPKKEKEEERPRLSRSQSMNKEKQDIVDERKESRTDRAKAREESKKDKSESPEKKKETRSTTKLEQEKEKRDKSISGDKSESKDSKDRIPREKKVEKKDVKPDITEEVSHREKKPERSWRDRFSKDDKPKIRNDEKPSDKEKNDNSNKEKSDNSNNNKEKNYMNKEKNDINKEKNDINKEKNDINKDKNDMNKEKSDTNKEKSDTDKEKSDINKEKSDINKEKKTIKTESPKHEAKLMREKRERSNVVPRGDISSVSVTINRIDDLLANVSSAKEMNEVMSELMTKNKLRKRQDDQLKEVKTEKIDEWNESAEETPFESRGPPNEDDDKDDSKEGPSRRCTFADDRDDDKSLLDVTEWEDDVDDSSSEKDGKEKNIEIGDKVRVKYGRGRTRKVYEAKVLDIDTKGGEKKYYVHYAGWNTRYDEWIKRNCIVENLTEKEKLSRQRRQDLLSKGGIALPLGKKFLIGKPGGIPGVGKLIRKNSTSSTTSVSSSRTTRSDKNNSLHTSPFSGGLQPKRRMRRKSGLSNTLTDTSQDSDTSDIDDDMLLFQEGEGNDEDGKEKVEQEGEPFNKSSDNKCDTTSGQNTGSLDAGETSSQGVTDSGERRFRSVIPGVLAHAFIPIPSLPTVAQREGLQMKESDLKKLKDHDSGKRYLTMIELNSIFSKAVFSEETPKSSDTLGENKASVSDSTDGSSSLQLSASEEKTPIVKTHQLPETSASIAKSICPRDVKVSLRRDINLEEACKVRTSEYEQPAVEKVASDSSVSSTAIPDTVLKKSDDTLPKHLTFLSSRDSSMPDKKQDTYEGKSTPENPVVKYKKEIFAKSEECSKSSSLSKFTVFESKPRDKILSKPSVVVQHVGLFGDINFSTRPDISIKKSQEKSDLISSKECLDDGKPEKPQQSKLSKEPLSFTKVSLHIPTQVTAESKISDAPKESLTAVSKPEEPLIKTMLDPSKYENELVKLEKESTTLKEGSIVFKVDPTKFKEDLTKLGEDLSKFKEDSAKLEEDSTKFKEEPSKFKEDSTKLKDVLFKSQEPETASSEKSSLLSSFDSLKTEKVIVPSPVGSTSSPAVDFSDIFKEKSAKSAVVSSKPVESKSFDASTFLPKMSTSISSSDGPQSTAKLLGCFMSIAGSEVEPDEKVSLDVADTKFVEGVTFSSLDNREEFVDDESTMDKSDVSKADSKDTALQTSVITFVSSSFPSTTDLDKELEKKSIAPVFECSNENTDDYELGSLTQETSFEGIKALTSGNPSPKPEVFDSKKVEEDSNACTEEEEVNSGEDSLDSEKKSSEINKINTTFEDSIHESLTELSIDDESKDGTDRPERNFALTSNPVGNVFSTISADKSLKDSAELFSVKKINVDTISFGIKKDEGCSKPSSENSSLLDKLSDDNVDSDKTVGNKDSEDNSSSSGILVSKKEGKKKKSKIGNKDKKGANLEFGERDDSKAKEGKVKSKKKRALDSGDINRGRDSEQKIKVKKFKKSKSKKRFMKLDELGDNDKDDISEKMKRKEKRKREERKFSKFETVFDMMKGESSKKEKKKGRKSKLGSDRKAELGEKKVKKKKKMYLEEAIIDSDSEKESYMRMSEKKKKKEKKKLKDVSSSDDTTEGKLLIDEAKSSGEKAEDPDMSFLLCEEKVPASPVNTVPDDTTASSSIDESINVSPSSDEEPTPVVNLEMYSRSSGLGLLGAVQKRSNDTCAVLDNTPPTTPSSTESIPSSSPSPDREPFVHYTESTQSGRDSGDGEYDGFPCSSGRADDAEGGDYRALATLAMAVCKSVSGKLPLKRQKSENDDCSPSKKRKKPKRSFGASDAPSKPTHARVKGFRYPKGDSFDAFDSPEHYQTNIGSPTRASVSSSFSHSFNQQTSFSSDISSVGFMRASKSTFYIPLNEYTDPDKRIAILQDKMSELKKVYTSLKQEVATIDRRRKKARKKMREAAGSNANNSSVQPEEAQNCS